MFKVRKYFSIIFLLSGTGCFFMQTTKGFNIDWFEITRGNIDSYDDLTQFIPSSVKEIQDREKQIIKEISEKLDRFKKQDRLAMTVQSVLYGIDTLSHAVHSGGSSLYLMSMVHPEKEMRDAGQQSSLNLGNFSVENFNTKEVYALFESFFEREDLMNSLNKEEQYFLDDIKLDFKLSGLMLDDDKFKAFKVLQKEAMALSSDFGKNISTDESSMFCDREELKGMNASLVDALEKNEDGKYIIKTDYPTGTELLSFCEVEKTREKFWYLFNNRAYPENVSVLQRLLEVRQEMAIMLGFKNYAEMSISSSMAKTPKKVRSFMEGLAKKAKKKSVKEVAAWKKNGKDLVLFDGDKIFPWNVGFLKKAYERDHFNFDERELRPYFSMEDAIAGLFSTYQDFFGLRFEIAAAKNVWHEDVKIITVYDKGAVEPRGYIFLDLHPRKAKHSHPCHVGLIHTTYLPNGEHTKSASVVIANFPKPTETEPSLLKYSDVVTFFHEFGHAMHSLLGRTHFATQSGTLVLRDFVEMPSQMFEEWLWEPKMIKKIGRHYQTGAPLSDELIEKMLAKKKYDVGFGLSGQLSHSDFSLTVHEEKESDFDELKKKIAMQYSPEIVWNDNNHHYCAFGHLAGYDAKYYGYLWSKVFALDIFEQLKKDNFSPEAGKRFVEMVLGKGGSVHPDELLENYLGRKPSMEPFFKAYDLQ